MNKSNTKPKNLPQYKTARDFRVYVCSVLFVYEYLFILLCIAAATARRIVFIVFASLTTSGTTDAFYTFFLGSYKIYYSGSQNNHYYC